MSVDVDPPPPPAVSVVSADFVPLVISVTVTGTSSPSTVIEPTEPTVRSPASLAAADATICSVAPDTLMTDPLTVAPRLTLTSSTRRGSDGRKMTSLAGRLVNVWVSASVNAVFACVTWSAALETAALSADVSGAADASLRAAWVMASASLRLSIALWVHSVVMPESPCVGSGAGCGAAHAAILSSSARCAALTSASSRRISDCLGPALAVVSARCAEARLSCAPESC